VWVAAAHTKLHKNIYAFNIYIAGVIIVVRLPRRTIIITVKFLIPGFFDGIGFSTSSTASIRVRGEGARPG
jgi:hypothetical protein